MHWVVTCPVCDEDSTLIYRCEHCGADLAERPDSALDLRRVREDVTLAADLVDVAFPIQCLDCERRHDAAIAYSDVGRVLQRYPCPHCEQATRHRPVGEDAYRHHPGARTDPLDLPATVPDATSDTAEADV